MTETCVKDLRPGTVVELPKNLEGHKYGMYIGGRLVANGIQPVFGVPSGCEFIYPGAEIVVPETKYTEASKDHSQKFLKTITDRVKKQEFIIPYLGLTSGADPEIFVLDGKDQVIPAWEFLPAEKDAALNCADPFGYSFWDGYQAEFAPTANHCLERVGDNIHYNLVKMRLLAQKFDPKAHFTLNNTVKLPVELLKKASDEQIRFRCSSSYNVYRDVSEAPPDPRTYPFRFCGGHIHLGLKSKIPAIVIEEVIKGLDAVLGVAGVSLAAGIDSPDRRTMYGRAGEFRLPEHGIEYRVLSNFWLSHPGIYHLVFELARQVFRASYSGLVATCWEAKEQETRDVINSNDVNGARKILTRNLGMLSCLVKQVWGNSIPSDKAIKTILNGIEVAVSDPLNIEENWDLGGKKWLALGHHPGGSWYSQSRLK